MRRPAWHLVVVVVAVVAKLLGAFLAVVAFDHTQDNSSFDVDHMTPFLLKLPAMLLHQQTEVDSC